MSEIEPQEAKPKLAIVKTQTITRFDENALNLRREWSKRDIAPGYAWRQTSTNESSDSRPFNVVDDKSGQTGKAKPGEILAKVFEHAGKKADAVNGLEHKGGLSNQGKSLPALWPTEH